MAIDETQSAKTAKAESESGAVRGKSSPVLPITDEFVARLISDLGTKEDANGYQHTILLLLSVRCSTGPPAGYLAPKFLVPTLMSSLYAFQGLVSTINKFSHTHTHTSSLSLRFRPHIWVLMIRPIWHLHGHLWVPLSLLPNSSPLLMLICLI